MFKTTGIEDNEFVEYKGRPLVRKDDDFYYGDLSDESYVFMMVMNDKKVGEETVPGMMMVQLIDAKTKVPTKQKTVNSLSEALEYADAWLTFN